tara:strand:+ start:2490 stop:2612 length:123 start_codon:yes stop_codon:yes gene_type:complete
MTWLIKIEVDNEKDVDFILANIDSEIARIIDTSVEELDED